MRVNRVNGMLLFCRSLIALAKSCGSISVSQPWPEVAANGKFLTQSGDSGSAGRHMHSCPLGGFWVMSFGVNTIWPPGDSQLNDLAGNLPALCE
jgi:hypothetical protein